MLRGQWLWLLTQRSLCYVFRNCRRTTWYGSANHSDNDENKHDKVTFQLAAVDLNSVHLCPEIVVTDIVF